MLIFFPSEFKFGRAERSEAVRKDRLLGQCGKLDIVGTHLVTLAIDDIG